MKRRLISLFLCAALLMTIVPCITVSASYNGINYDRIVEDMVNYFKGKEGDYDSVCNDNGGPSVGILQWHNVRALRLLKRIIKENPQKAKDTLGSSLYNEIQNASDSKWNGRVLNSDERSRLSKLLGSADGIRVQDLQSYEDISGYVDHGYRLGIRTDPALEYFCDIENHYGSGGCESVVKKVKNGYGISTITSLDQFHKGVGAYVNAYMTRRNSTYNYIKNTLGYDTSGKLVTLPDNGTVVVPPEPEEICIGCPGEMYVDMPAMSNWAHTGIEFVLYAGLFCGTTNTTFEPNTSMSRAMLVQVLYSLDNGSENWETGDAASGTFTDVVSGIWYEKPVLWAAGRGIVSGIGEGQFDPNGNVTREQIAAILYRYSLLKGYDVSDSADLTKFSDASKVSDYAKTAMSWAVAEGLISGESNRGVASLNPTGAASRAQVAVMIMRFTTEYLAAQQ